MSRKRIRRTANPNKRVFLKKQRIETNKDTEMETYPVHFSATLNQQVFFLWRRRSARLFHTWTCNVKKSGREE